MEGKNRRRSSHLPFPSVADVFVVHGSYVPDKNQTPRKKVSYVPGGRMVFEMVRGELVENRR